MDRNSITSDDEGKRVVNFDGDEIGVVSGVDGDMAHVAPDAGISDSIRSKLGWEDEDSDYVLESDQVKTVTDDEVRLQEET
jgi:hypothetical protein